MNKHLKHVLKYYSIYYTIVFVLFILEYLCKMNEFFGGNPLKISNKIPKMFHWEHEAMKHKL